MIDVDGIPIEDEMAAEAVRRCTAAIIWVKRANDENLEPLLAILTGEELPPEAVDTGEPEYAEGDMVKAIQGAPPENETDVEKLRRELREKQ